MIKNDAILIFVIFVHVHMPCGCECGCSPCVHCHHLFPRAHAVVVVVVDVVVGGGGGVVVGHDLVGVGVGIGVVSLHGPSVKVCEPRGVGIPGDRRHCSRISWNMRR